MKTDIQIAQETKLLPIAEIASKLDIADDELELYGKYKAKISDAFIARNTSKKDGKLILVTAINPTPAGAPVKNKYFGTDGFRGEANLNLTSMHAYKVGRFLGWYYSSKLSGSLGISYPAEASSVRHP